MRKSLLLVCIAVALLMSTACSRRMVYDKYVNTPLAGWEKNDTISFAIPPVDSTTLYDTRIGLRITDAYPFTAITMIVEQRLLPGNKVFVDTVNCKLTDRRGNPSGNGLSYHQYVFPVRSMQLQHGDSIYVRIRHDMKREILPGISDVGMLLHRE